MYSTATLFRRPAVLLSMIGRCYGRKQARTLPALILVSMTWGAMRATAQTSTSLNLESRANSEYPSLLQLYRHLHINPELSFHESKTSERLQQELRSVGFEVTGNFGGYGFVGVLKNGAGPTVMIRTDLDALPVTEQTGLEYASQVKTKDDQGNDVGVMHACGHDIHMTCFVGTARLLSQLKDRWRGTVIMIGQPAEERGGGAKAMLDAGLFQKFPKPDYVLALHDGANLEAGQVGQLRRSDHSRYIGPWSLVLHDEGSDCPRCSNHSWVANHCQSRDARHRSGSRDGGLDPRRDKTQHHTG
jgi:hypothetical protein